MRTAQRRSSTLRRKHNQLQAVPSPLKLLSFSHTSSALLALVLGVTALTFLPVVNHEFTNWDDPQNVTMNSLVMSPSWSGVVQVWASPINSMYSPLVFSSFILDSLIGGGAPWIFHTTNLLLHLGSTAAVYLLLRRFVPGPSFAGPLAGVLLFAVHPVQTEPVAWVTGRKDVLSGFLVLLAMVLYFAAHGAALRKAQALKVFSAGAYLLSLLAKATNVALPLGIFALDVLVLKTPWKKAAVRLAPWAVIAAIISLLAISAEGQPEWLKNTVPVYKRPLLAGYSFIIYPGRVLWPVGLSPVYPVNATEAVHNVLSVPGLCLLALAAAAAAYLRGRTAAVFALFVLPLLPVLGLVPFLYQQVAMTADRYLYVSMFGVALGMGWSVDYIMRSTSRRWAPAAFLVVLVVACCAASNRQARFWRNSEALWSRAVALTPGVPEAHTNLALALHDRGEAKAAEAQLEKAVEADPEFSLAWNLLGLLRLQRLGPDAAIPPLTKAVHALEKRGRRDKQLADAYNNLGVARLERKQFGLAEAAFRKALDVLPSPEARANLDEALQARARQHSGREAN